MPAGVMIRGTYVPKNRPARIVVSAIVLGIIGGVNLGIGLNYTCYSSSHYWQVHCDNQRNGYIIAGSVILAMSALVFMSALVLHLKIKKLLKMTENVVVQQDIATPSPYPRQQSPVVYEYPVVVTNHQSSSHQPPPHYPAPHQLPPHYPVPYQPPPHQSAPPPIGFGFSYQPTQPQTPYPKEQYEQPPPYSP